MLPAMNTPALSKNIVLMLFLFSMNLQAAECTVLQYLQNKSQGVEIGNNTCTEANQLAIGTQFSLLPGARLWLRSNLQTETQRQAQIICQNQANHNVSIEVSSLFLPWIKAQSLEQCSSWSHNKLTCEDNNGNKNAFFCMAASIKRPNFRQAQKPERSTSVVMRKIYVAETGYAYFKEVIDFITPEVDLCKQLYTGKGQFKVQWDVNAYGRVEQISVNYKQQTNNPRLYECVKTVVEQFEYPLMSKSSTFSHTF